MTEIVNLLEKLKRLQKKFSKRRMEKKCPKCHEAQPLPISGPLNRKCPKCGYKEEPADLHDHKPDPEIADRLKNLTDWKWDTRS